MKLTHNEVDNFENDLREIERRLEEIGSSICNAENSEEAWNAINDAINSVQEAIHCSWIMRA